MKRTFEINRKYVDINNILNTYIQLWSDALEEEVLNGKDFNQAIKEKIEDIACKRETMQIFKVKQDGSFKDRMFITIESKLGAKINMFAYSMDFEETSNELLNLNKTESNITALVEYKILKEIVKLTKNSDNFYNFRFAESYEESIEKRIENLNKKFNLYINKRNTESETKIILGAEIVALCRNSNNKDDNIYTKMTVIGKFVDIEEMINNDYFVKSYLNCRM